MKRLYLIRHGEQARWMDNPGLSDRGKRQAAATGIYLASLAPDGIAGIHASTKNRAKETAREISLAFGDVPIIYDEELVEKKIFMGSYENHNDFVADWKRSLVERDWKPQGGESGIEAGARMDRVLQALPDSERPYIIVAHGGIIADHLRNVFPLHEIDTYRQGFSVIGKEGSVGIQHCSATTLILDGGTYSIEGVDSIRHLEGVGIGEGRPTGERK